MSAPIITSTDIPFAAYPRAVEDRDRLTEAGAAERFARLHGDDVRFDHRRQRWLLWQGHRWLPDADAAMTRLALDFAREWQREAVGVGDRDRREKTVLFTIRLERRDTMNNMLALSKALKPIADAGDTWDHDPWLLGVPNGVVDVRTGVLRSGRRDDRITLLTGVEYHPDARSNLWDHALRTILPDEALIDFVQVAAGYSATGDTRRDCWFLACGTGRNGKGTLLQPIGQALGEYARELPGSIFNLRSERSPYELARLPGKRFVTSSESGDTLRLHHDRIKQLIGGDKMSAADKYEQSFEFQPACKLWLSCNRKPTATDDTAAFWARVFLIPFVVSFVGKEDRTLRPALVHEPAHQAAVLAWIVRGAVRYVAEGLEPPAIVCDATAEYRETSDALGYFLTEACDRDANAQVAANELYEHYTRWAHAQHYTDKERHSATMFGRLMGGRFDHRKDRATGVKFYMGIARKGIF